MQPRRSSVSLIALRIPTFEDPLAPKTARLSPQDEKRKFVELAMADIDADQSRYCRASIDVDLDNPPGACELSSSTLMHRHWLFRGAGSSIAAQ